MPCNIFFRSPSAVNLVTGIDIVRFWVLVLVLVLVVFFENLVNCKTL